MKQEIYLTIQGEYTPSELLKTVNVPLFENPQYSENIQIISMVCENTIDEDIEELLDKKMSIVSQVLDGEEMMNDVEVVKESIFKEIIKTLLKKKNN